MVKQLTRISGVGSQDEPTSYFTNPLYEAINKKNLSLVKSLFEADADVNKCDKIFHESVLHIAIQRRNNVT